jgi:glycosyltransferase involved in cell wall biosynthesis
VGQGTLPRRVYTASDVAILVPTKDRPAKLSHLLQTLADQEQKPGRVIIVDGGESVAEVVSRFESQLAVERYACLPPGQIRQRNMAISLLDHRTPLAVSFDDDIECEPDAIGRMVAFWNQVEPETAAVSFNIVNTPPEPNTWLRRLFWMAGTGPGQVLRSGMPTSNCQVTSDARVEWVCGGATAWRTEILQSHPHTPLPAKWAIAEDVVYSYPIGRSLPLYVCAGARVRHEHVFDYAVKQPHRFHGYTQTLWLYHFVESNSNLSSVALTINVLATAVGRVAAALAGGGRRHLAFARGQFHALSKVLLMKLRGGSAAQIITSEVDGTSR